MNIIYTSDSAGFNTLPTILYSVMKFNPGNNDTVFILSEDDMDSNTVSSFTQLCNKFAYKFSFLKMEFGNYTPEFMTSRTWVRPFYYRLFVALTLPNNIDEALYMDADIICNAKINWPDLTDIAWAGVDDKNTGAQHNGRVGMHSGVCFFNIKKLRDNWITCEQIMRDIDADFNLREGDDEGFRANPDWMTDTYVLNEFAMSLGYKKLPQRYNFHTWYYDALEGLEHRGYMICVEAEAYLEQVLPLESLEEYRNVILLHYEGYLKPWDIPGGLYKQLEQELNLL